MARHVYYATYTAYDGRMILPQFLETQDFLRFKFITLNGPAVENKGMALFPRKVNGLYAMLGRQDAENIYVMFSDHLHFWDSMQLILEPAFPWEFIQMGNCGSPIETEAGWLVISHGVGPMRKYCIGAFLLDRDDPTKVIGRLPEPLIKPNAKERDGYVPNVVYSCGSLVHNGQLVIPYGISDYATTFATIPLRTSPGRNGIASYAPIGKICTRHGRTCICFAALMLRPSRGAGEFQVLLTRTLCLHAFRDALWSGRRMALTMH